MTNNPYDSMFDELEDHDNNNSIDIIHVKYYIKTMGDENYYKFRSYIKGDYNLYLKNNFHDKMFYMYIKSNNFFSNENNHVANFKYPPNLISLIIDTISFNFSEYQN